MAKNVEDTIAQANASSTKIQQASEKANDMVSQFQKQNISQAVGQTVANARDTSEQIKSAVSSAERYIAASERASDVQQYLESRFELKPDAVGTIPLDDKPPAAAGQETWNGVCLALVVSRETFIETASRRKAAQSACAVPA